MYIGAVLVELNEVGDTIDSDRVAELIYRRGQYTSRLIDTYDTKNNSSIVSIDLRSKVYVLYARSRNSLIRGFSALDDKVRLISATGSIGVVYDSYSSHFGNRMKAYGKRALTPVNVPRAKWKLRGTGLAPSLAKAVHGTAFQILQSRGYFVTVGEGHVLSAAQPSNPRHTSYIASQNLPVKAIGTLLNHGRAITAVLKNRDAGLNTDELDTRLDD